MLLVPRLAENPYAEIVILPTSNCKIEVNDVIPDGIGGRIKITPNGNNATITVDSNKY